MAASMRLKFFALNFRNHAFYNRFHKLNASLSSKYWIPEDIYGNSVARGAQTRHLMWLSDDKNGTCSRCIDFNIPAPFLSFSRHYCDDRSDGKLKDDSEGKKVTRGRRIRRKNNPQIFRIKPSMQDLDDDNIYDGLDITLNDSFGVEKKHRKQSRKPDTDIYRGHDNDVNADGFKEEKYIKPGKFGKQQRTFRWAEDDENYEYDLGNDDDQPHLHQQGPRSNHVFNAKYDRQNYSKSNDPYQSNRRPRPFRKENYNFDDHINQAWPKKSYDDFDYETRRSYDSDGDDDYNYKPKRSRSSDGAGFKFRQSSGPTVPRNFDSDNRSGRSPRGYNDFGNEFRGDSFKSRRQSRGFENLDDDFRGRKNAYRKPPSKQFDDYDDSLDDWSGRIKSYQKPRARHSDYDDSLDDWNGRIKSYQKPRSRHSDDLGDDFSRQRNKYPKPPPRQYGDYNQPRQYGDYNHSVDFHGRRKPYQKSSRYFDGLDDEFRGRKQYRKPSSSHFDDFDINFSKHRKQYEPDSKSVDKIMSDVNEYENMLGAGDPDSFSSPNSEQTSADDGDEVSKPVSKKVAADQRMKTRKSRAKVQFNKGDSEIAEKESTSNKPYPVQGELLFGIHPVLLAMKQNKRKIHKLYMRKVENGYKNPLLDQIVELGMGHKIPIEYITKNELEMMTNHRIHQGVILDVDEIPVSSLNISADLLSQWDNSKKPQLWLVLHNITDPMKCGNMLRSAYFLGVDKVVFVNNPMNKNAKQEGIWRFSSALSSHTSKASAGTMEVLDMNSVEDITKSLKTLKSAGWEIIAPAASQVQYRQATEKSRVVDSIDTGSADHDDKLNEISETPSTSSETPIEENYELTAQSTDDQGIAQSSGDDSLSTDAGTEEITLVTDKKRKAQGKPIYTIGDFKFEKNTVVVLRGDKKCLKYCTSFLTIPSPASGSQGEGLNTVTVTGIILHSLAEKRQVSD